MNKELIEEYIQNQIKTIAKQSNVDKDTLMAIKGVMVKCKRFSDIIDHGSELPECDMTGLDVAKLFTWWHALAILRDTSVIEEKLPETINAMDITYANDFVNYNVNRVFNFTTEDPEYPNLCVIAAGHGTEAVYFGFSYNSKKIIKSFVTQVKGFRARHILKSKGVKLLPEDVNYKYDFVKLPVKTQRIFLGYVAAKIPVQTLTYDGPYGKCTYSNKYIEERVDEFGNPALYQIRDDCYGVVDGEYDMAHMHLGNLSLSVAFTMPELLCYDLAYSGCIKPVNLEGFCDESKELFYKMSKQKPDNFEILAYIRDAAGDDLDKLPGAALLDCQTKEAADELLALLKE